MPASLTSQRVAPVCVALEPVWNALHSLSLLNEVERLPGLNVWVRHTAAALTAEQRYTHRLLFEGLRDALTPMQDEPHFPAYLHHLAEIDPYILRKRVLEALRGRFSRFIDYATPDSKRLLNDVSAYLHCARHIQGDRSFDAELHTQAHALLQDPPALQSLILSHLEQMWKTTLAAEWRRTQRSLQWQVEMFSHSLDEEATIEETFYGFTGRQLPAAISEGMGDSGEVVLIPSWHAGRHVTCWQGADWDGELSSGTNAVARLFFSEPPNYDVALLQSAPVGRSELRARLAALADETRLRIVELLTQQDEMHAQEIIAALDLSQSSVSRHLKQLASLGYLYERRGEGANKTYRLSSFFFTRTAQALQQLVSADGNQAGIKKAARDDTLQQELKRFLDRSGRLTTWPPAKQRDKVIILEYLAGFFEQGREYNEKEVNELLTLHSTMQDAAALRRAMNEYHFMNRTRDGSRYWLIGPDMPEKELSD